MLFRIVGFVSLVLLALSFLGALHPLFDSLAIVRMLMLLGALPLMFLYQGKIRIAIGAALAILTIPFYVIIPQASSDVTPTAVIFQHNLLFTSEAPDLELVTSQLEPDIILLQEIKDARETLKSLKKYPYQQLCEFADVGDVGILSPTPFLDQGCSEGQYRGFAWARVDIDGEPITFVSMHLYWPFPFGQPNQLNETIPQLANLPRPVVLAGDFNHVPWSYSVGQVEKAIDGKIVRGLRPSLTMSYKGRWLWPALPIDHAIFPDGITTARKLDRYSSDHNAIVYNWYRD